MVVSFPCCRMIVEICGPVAPQGIADVVLGLVGGRNTVLDIVLYSASYTAKTGALVGHLQDSIVLTLHLR